MKRMLARPHAWHRALLPVIIAALSLTISVHAQQQKKPPTYEAQLQNAVLRPRTGAPLVAEVKIINRSSDSEGASRLTPSDCLTSPSRTTA